MAKKEDLFTFCSIHSYHSDHHTTMLYVAFRCILLTLPATANTEQCSTRSFIENPLLDVDIPGAVIISFHIIRAFRFDW